MLNAVGLWLVFTLGLAGAPAQSPSAALSAPAPSGGAAAARPSAPAAVTTPPGYTIGPDDRLAINFWRDKDLSSDVVVRPDGRISLPLLNDVVAAGLTPEALRQQLVELAKRFVAEPTATVIVTEIRSRHVFITGNVEKPGSFSMNVPITVLQLIASAGGLREFVSGKNIVIVRNDGGHQTRFNFDYQAAVKGALRQNIELKPGDTVIVP